jgi:hypothetical protein
VFELTAVDRTKATRKDVQVTVLGKVAAQGTFSDPPAPTTKDDRTITARGSVVGTVVNKGKAWVEVRSDSGKTTRYIPRWVGGMPAQGGGPEARIADAIARLNVGDRVAVQWLVNDHVRIQEIRRAP